ncbi:hypothetical protein FV242_21935 [Methylobacterium sp. WL64]|uniref:hypothetical protein n=1 Tax=Methylobacterium sp. WL64 TaxID=2603894 RepID=UPI0011C88304|nr:hypothetical protein [Methylobacterium sp. WL64]TXN00499.1 hypothetical protein FV242_21935 [Methylobacterium sp. WL64]
MVGGFPTMPPLPPTFWELQERQDERAWENLVAEVQRFNGDLPKGMVMLVTTSLDPTFYVVTMRRSGSYVILDGIDGDGHSGRVLQHVSQLSIRMQTVPKAEQRERGVFGFIEHGQGQ